MCVCTSRYFIGTVLYVTFLDYRLIYNYRGPRFDDYINQSRNMIVVKDPGIVISFTAPAVFNFYLTK